MILHLLMPKCKANYINHKRKRLWLFSVRLRHITTHRPTETSRGKRTKSQTHFSRTKYGAPTIVPVANALFAHEFIQNSRLISVYSGLQCVRRCEWAKQRIAAAVVVDFGRDSVLHSVILKISMLRCVSVGASTN